MNWNQFREPFSHMCLTGTVATAWSLAQEVASSSPFTVSTNIFTTLNSSCRKVMFSQVCVKNSVHRKFSENI